MDYKLDIFKDIPYYTNRSDRLFGWFSIYNDGAIIQELDRFSNVDYTKIPKDEISYFGLYGCGFHLISDFKTGSMYVYGKGSNKEFLFDSSFLVYPTKMILGESNKFEIKNIYPFQLKGFIYDMPSKSNKEYCVTDRYFAGYTGDLQLDDQIKVSIKVYFSLNILKYPNSIGIIFNILPKSNIKNISLERNYTFSVVETIKERYSNGQETIKNLSSPSYINLSNLKNNFKKKVIVNYRK